MSTQQATPANVDVPELVYKTFLANLTEGKASAELVERLRKALLEKQVLTEVALKAAIFD
ncbi:MAG: hypothetical protein WCO56_07265 [Verrucomicrobiota bacterium]